MQTFQWKMKSRLGPFYLLASANGLRAIFRNKQDAPMVPTLRGKTPEIKILAVTVTQLEGYLDGKRKSFDLPLDVTGTAFQKRVWEELQKIPYGKTASYKEIARRIHNAKAVRAVGNANGKNPLCMIIPCHRVIAADGTLGGYSGGLDMKRALLKLEAR